LIIGLKVDSWAGYSLSGRKNPVISISIEQNDKRKYRVGTSFSQIEKIAF
jgi:hypothetical protein